MSTQLVINSTTFVNSTTLYLSYVVNMAMCFSWVEFLIVETINLLFCQLNYNRAYARDIIITPGSYAGMPTEWQKITFPALTGHTSNRKVLSDCIKQHQTTLNSLCQVTLPLDFPFTLCMLYKLEQYQHMECQNRSTPYMI